MLQLVHVQRDFIKYFFAVSENLKKGFCVLGGAFHIWSAELPIENSKVLLGKE